VLADGAVDLTETKVRRAVTALARGRWVLTDDRTHELLVRTYVRHDRVMERRNMGCACARALGAVISPVLRDATLRELARLHSDEPSLAGWVGLKAESPDAYDEVCAMASSVASPKASRIA
jgi:hypothetical protein